MGLDRDRLAHIGLYDKRLRSGLRSGDRLAIGGALGAGAGRGQGSLSCRTSCRLRTCGAVLLGSRSGSLCGTLSLFARRRGRRVRCRQRFAPLGKAVLGHRIDRLQHLLDGGTVEVGQHFDTKLVEQRTEFNSGLLGNKPLEAGHLSGIVFLLRDDAREIERRQGPAIERHEVPAKTG